MEKDGSYYDRALSSSFSQLIEEHGQLRWLFDFVKEQDDLDFLIGKNKTGKNQTKEWISVYRGLTRLISISKRRTPDAIKIDADDSYKKIEPDLYGNDIPVTKNFKFLLSDLLNKVRKNEKFDRYYNNKKEGYYQNKLSRKYGINGSSDSDFVIVDKEAVIGYESEECKNAIFGECQKKYKELQKEISIDHKKYGKDLEKKSIGNELDFIAVDKTGNILLIEYKHGTNTAGIYLSPLQIGLYYDLFTKFDRKTLDESILSQIEQKQKIGLINPDWKIPEKLKDIIPVLIISEYNYRSAAKSNYNEIMGICKNKLGNNFLKNIRTYNYTTDELTDWKNEVDNT